MTPEKNEPLAYKLKDAAAKLGVSVTSLRRAIRQGLLRPSRAFRHIIISTSELNRFLITTTLNAEGGKK